MEQALSIFVSIEFEHQVNQTNNIISSINSEKIMTRPYPKAAKLQGVLQVQPSVDTGRYTPQLCCGWVCRRNV